MCFSSLAFNTFVILYLFCILGLVPVFAIHLCSVKVKVMCSDLSL